MASSSAREKCSTCSGAKTGGPSYVYVVKSYDDDERPKDLLWSRDFETAHSTFAGAVASAKKMFAVKKAEYSDSESEDSDSEREAASRLAATIDYKGDNYGGESMNFSDILDNGYSIVIYRMALVE